MATVDAVMSDKRAADIIAKYRSRVEALDEGDLHEANAVLTEMQSDISNGINAAVAETLASVPAAVSSDDDDEDDKPSAKRGATTHMPATGSHAKGK